VLQRNTPRDGRLSDNAPRRSRRDNRVARKRAEESPGSTGHGAR